LWIVFYSGTLVAQELEDEKAALEAELRNLETCVEQKEQLLEDQKNRLQLEVQHKDLEIKKCQTESAAKQVTNIIIWYLKVMLLLK
jgi:Skp family chaperone for outer membrane proteins